MKHKIKAGDQYFMLWNDNIAGPFTYEGGSNYLFKGFITGDVKKLTLAKEGFAHMLSHYKFDERDFYGQLPDMLLDAALDVEIVKANTPELKQALKALKDCAYDILHPGVEV